MCFAIVSHQIDYHKIFFPRSLSEASSELLQKDCEGLGGAQEKEVTQFGDIDAFVEELNSADDRKRIIGISETFYCSVAFLL